jgi:DNA-binding transcriptional LysR family regulator
MWDLNRLRMLRELELRGTITQVAASLGYSPSSVSQQLGQLEREVGVALLEPDGRRVRLTAHGRRLARHAEQVMQLQEGVRSELDASAPEREVVRVATIASAGRALIPRALDALASHRDRLRMEIFVVAPEYALAELEARRYDLVIAEQYPGHARERRDGVEYRHLGYDPIRVVLPASNPARSLADLRESAWVLEPPGSAARHWAVQQCRAAGFEPDVRFEATDLDVHIALIASRHAVGILADLVRADHEPSVRLIDLPTALRRELFTAVRAPAASAPGIRAARGALAEAFQAMGAGNVGA